ncbi:MAG TPA: hypothetical protein PL183_05930 [Aquamicrobium sp.]|nr:hypothetical protein [Aquamicrobium sp.]
MTPWNRLRQLAERMIAGDERRAAADDAIYLSETAYRNSRPGAAAAPAIRERHFGIGARRRKAGEETAGIEAGKPRGLLARLGLRRQQAAPGDPAYAGTKIVGTPLPPSTPKAPAAAKKAATAPETPAVATAERPAAKPVSAPAVEPAVAAPRKAPSAPAAAPVIRPTPEKPVDDEAMLRHLFGEPEPAKPPKPKATKPAKPAAKPTPAKAAPVAPKAKKKKMDRGDVTVATLGVVLAVTCAAFPWYIFFNQEKFGVREFVFSGERGSSWPAPGLAFVPQPVGKPFANAEVPKMELDFFPTATLPADGEPGRAVPASEQPFPADRVNFRLVHVANGRAMIEDADGLWVVQRGSRLPDSSHVVAIEQRGGRWVLLTSNDGIVELQAN